MLVMRGKERDLARPGGRSRIHDRFRCDDGCDGYAQMRRETKAYAKAVIKEHPYLDPNNTEDIENFDPYPLVKDSMQTVTLRVAQKYNVTVAELRGMGKTKNLSLARQEAFLHCRKILGRSYPEIGKFFGDRDHTTVLYGCRRAEDPAYRRP